MIRGNLTIGGLAALGVGAVLLLVGIVFRGIGGFAMAGAALAAGGAVCVAMALAVGELARIADALERLAPPPARILEAAPREPQGAVVNADEAPPPPAGEEASPTPAGDDHAEQPAPAAMAEVVAPPEPPGVEAVPADPLPAPQTYPAPVVVKTGMVGAVTYALYSDGSIDAEFTQGRLQFRSVDELQAYLQDSMRASHPS